MDVVWAGLVVSACIAVLKGLLADLAKSFVVHAGLATQGLLNGRLGYVAGR